MAEQNRTVTVVGAGLAGSEAAWQLAEAGLNVVLYEMKPDKMSPAHVYDGFGELVCSNSLRGAGLETAPGLLKEELRRFGSLIMRCADATQVSAGGALAVDRIRFSDAITESIRNHPRIQVITSEVMEIPPSRPVIIATGPLTSDSLANSIIQFFDGEDSLSFFDAAAPIVQFDSIDMSKAFFASRYGKGTADYINCPMDYEEYSVFQKELANGKMAQLRDFEDEKVFEGCVPVEVLARRGVDTLRYGPLKPVGIVDPKTGERPYAVVQLRRDNQEGTLYNIVGFQTHLTFGEQKRIFSMIPALHDAEFVRYGVMHRNTYINSPKLLNRFYESRKDTDVLFAGQITGVEGYIESTASGLYAAINLAARLNGKPRIDLDSRTAIGALSLYISGGAASDFQPMNINFGIIDSLECKKKKKRERNLEKSQRSLETIERLRSVCDENNS
ncbi:MAG: methylenetetrahydrofolate--tRNA-(uracil(54)-C(5))-methyltransferase (FADH(2)-oxidizing) TrmFO [Clostridiales bacterium]|jgi:methylenetetrahydrofolate--tRNA-(uracil-5-)-methyltransferase|nr:methylenetetrahydrofolate--tRNA-(uracil(54)-C(5))-methyltransferase (FADH(2)-oxidizing) TrmFO [Clostridiales bacterium]